MDAEELRQVKYITLGELLFLCTTEHAIPEMVLLLHDTTLMDKDSVGFVEHDACDGKC